MKLECFWIQNRLLTCTQCSEVSHIAWILTGNDGKNYMDVEVLLEMMAKAELKWTVTSLETPWQDVRDCRSQWHSVFVCMLLSGAPVHVGEYVYLGLFLFFFFSFFLSLPPCEFGFGLRQLLVVVLSSLPPTQKTYCIGQILCWWNCPLSVMCSGSSQFI